VIHLLTSECDGEVFRLCFLFLLFLTFLFPFSFLCWKLFSNIIYLYIIYLPIYYYSSAQSERTYFAIPVLVCSVWLHGGQPGCLSSMWQAILWKANICLLWCMWNSISLCVSANWWSRAVYSKHDGWVPIQVWFMC
jgi:hypothetical protein